MASLVTRTTCRAGTGSWTAKQTSSLCFSLTAATRYATERGIWSHIRLIVVQHIKYEDVICAQVCIDRCLERGKSSGRTDDNRESLEKRWDVYRVLNACLFDWFLCVEVQLKSSMSDCCGLFNWPTGYLRVSLAWFTSLSSPLCRPTPITSFRCFFSFLRRIQTYLNSTRPIIEQYQKHGKVRTIDASRSVDQVRKHRDTARHSSVSPFLKPAETFPRFVVFDRHFASNKKDLGHFLRKETTWRELIQGFQHFPQIKIWKVRHAFVYCEHQAKLVTGFFFPYLHKGQICGVLD